MLSRLLYYLLIKPLSLLPLALLYRLSDVGFLLVYNGIGYRKKVVFQNLKNSFPAYSPEEVSRVARLFYRHLCDLAVESIRLFSLSKEEAIARNKIVNPELANRYFDQGRSIVISMSHYNNWELSVLNTNPQLRHQVVGIYAPISNEFLNKKMYASRSRFGLELISKREVGKFHAAQGARLTATLIAGDQYPSPSAKGVYRMRFLNQESDVLFGTEKIAVQYNYPVLYAATTKVRRGYYETRLELVEHNPATAAPGSITEKHTRLLEARILAEPQYWLWSHKRWKKRPLKNAHK